MTDAELFLSFETYQRSRAFSEGTIRRRRCSLHQFAKHMTPLSVTTASVDDVEEWMGAYRKATTRKAYRSDLASFFRWAARRSLTDNNPMPMVDSVRVPRSMPKPAPPEAIAAAFTVADGDTQVMLLLGALAGLRRAEIANLVAADVYLDAEPPVIHVRHGKGDKDRIVPLHPTLVTHLRRQACWLYRPRAKYTPDAVGLRLRNALSSDDTRITGHQLRHYFGTEAARWSGGNVVLVAQLMGHEDPNTTMGYVKWSPTEGAEVVSKIVTAGVDDDFTQRRLRIEGKAS